MRVVGAHPMRYRTGVVLAVISAALLAPAAAQAATPVQGGGANVVQPLSTGSSKPVSAAETTVTFEIVPGPLQLSVDGSGAVLDRRGTIDRWGLTVTTIDGVRTVSLA